MKFDRSLKGCGIFLLFAGSLLAMGFGAGALFVTMTSGYHLNVSQEETHPFNPLKTDEGKQGVIRWRHAHETVGWGFMDPGTTSLEYLMYPNAGEGLVLYKRRRYFQESYPFARNLTIDGNTLRWEDGAFSFKLEMAPLDHPDFEAKDKSNKQSVKDQQYTH